MSKAYVKSHHYLRAHNMKSTMRIMAHYRHLTSTLGAIFLFVSSEFRKARIAS